MSRIGRYSRKGVYLIPSLFTSGNLFCGVFAVIAVFNAEYISAAIAILIAGVLDTLDGKLARLTRASSRFGLEYDSLADLVSFGVAPGVLIYSWALNAYGRLGWIAVFLFIVCGALRLARYNVQSGKSNWGGFIGLPIPAAASLIATLVIFDHHILRLGREVRPFFSLILTYLLAFLMVSNFRYRSFKQLNLRQQKPFHTLVAAILLLMLVAVAPQAVLFALSSLYLLSGVMERPARALYRRFFPGRAEIEREEREEDKITDPELWG